MLLFRSTSFLASLTLLSTAVAVPSAALASPSPTPARRDPLKQPFATTSIWNTPIGSNAVYKPTILAAEQYVTLDPNYLLRPARDGAYATYRLGSPDGPSYSSGGVTYGGRCSGTGDYGPILFPQQTVIGDATLAPTYSTPNNATAIVYPDNRTIAQLQPAARCGAGTDPHGYRPSEADLYGDGTYGGHFGSGLNSIGGQIAKGELTSAEPIRHALQLEVWGKKYLAFQAGTAQPGFRWPADRQDWYAKNTDGYCSMDPCLSKPDPSLKMGSLLAIKPGVTAQSLGITSKAGRKMLQALQNYGGYLVDDTGWEVNQIGIDADAVGDVDDADPAWHADVNALFAALHVIDNNGPRNIGGGGVPRVRPVGPLGWPASPDPIEVSRAGWRASAFASSDTAGKALDHTSATGWRSGVAQDNGQWFRVDLGRRATFNRLTFDSEAFPFDYPQDYDVYVSDNGTDWRKVTHGSGSRSTAITFPTQTASIVQITLTGGGIDPAHQRWSIGDLRLWNNPAVRMSTP